MKREEVLNVIRVAILDVTDRDYELKEDDIFQTNLNVDSLDVIEIVTVIEDRLDFDADTEAFGKITSVRQAIDAILDKVGKE